MNPVRRGPEPVVLRGATCSPSVLAMLALISVIAVALVGMTITALRVSSSFADSLDRTSAADSALDAVIHDLQREPLAAGEDCYGASDLGGAHTKAYQKLIAFPGGETMTVIVDCATTTPLTPSRDVTLTAFVAGQASALAQARIEIVDEIGGESRPGVELRICDWQLGQNLRTTAAACP